MDETRQNIDNIPTIPIADYDILDEDIEGWREEKEERERKLREHRKWHWPLTQGYGPPPKVSELGRRDRKNESYRQRWFEKHVLCAVGDATGSDHIPWCIRTPNGNCGNWIEVTSAVR